MTHITVIGLGGTIGMAASGGSGLRPSVALQDLVGAAGGGVGRTLELREIARCPSVALGASGLEALESEIAAARARGATGVVVVQGTDTLEEVAFAMDLALAPGAPVVFTGAMRGADSLGPDGPANLAAALRLAAMGQGQLGVTVVMNDLIHAARFVRKTHASAVDAFQSDPGGPLGAVVEAEVRLWVRRLPRLPATPQRVRGARPKVALLVQTLDDALEYASELPARGYAGLVVAGAGAGHVHPDAVRPLTELASRMPVVLCRRTQAGAAATRTYGYDGGEVGLLRAGLIAGGWLDPLKARVLLRHLIAANAGLAQIRRSFSAFAWTLPVDRQSGAA